MKYESASEQVAYLLRSYGTHGAVSNSMAETESAEHDSAYGQANHPVIIASPAPRFATMLSQTYELDRYHLVDNVLGPARQCGVNLERTSFERHITCYGLSPVCGASPDANLVKSPSVNKQPQTSFRPSDYVRGV